MALPSTLYTSSFTTAEPPTLYCHNPYATDFGAYRHPALPVTERAQHYCHNPYTLPHLGGQTWEETWSICMRPSGPPEAPPSTPCPSLDDLALGGISPSTSEDSLRSTQSDDPNGDTPKSQTSSASTSSGDGGSKPRVSGPLPTSRFPVSTKGRCHHRAHWLRLRGKRGYTYYLCKNCLCGWRKPRDPQAPDENEAPTA
eukprot:EG_transcript_6755